MNREQKRNLLNDVPQAIKNNYWISCGDPIELKKTWIPPSLVAWLAMRAIKKAGFARSETGYSFYETVYFTHRAPVSPRFFKKIKFQILSYPLYQRRHENA